MFFDSKERAYIAPFGLFLISLLVSELISKTGVGYSNWALAKPLYWIYPLQTLLCGGLVIYYWKHYEWNPLKGFWVALGIGVLVFVIWIAPQQWLGFEARKDGFKPDFFTTIGFPPLADQLSIIMRFIRLVIVVPLVEEIFWRGFLLRFLINESFHKVPFGTFQWRAFLITSAAFCLEHQIKDWPAALLAGVLFNLVAVKTKSLGACVIAHAITNLVLGIWILQSKQWGFW